MNDSRSGRNPCVSGARRKVTAQTFDPAPGFLPAARIAVLFGLFLTGCGEALTLADAYVVDSVYQSRAAAVAAGAIADDLPSGDRWLPGLLPESASNIRERHSLDTNEAWVAFTFDKEDANALTERCETVAPPQVDPPTDPNRFAGASPLDWWPDDLFETHGKYDFYRCGPRSYLAVDHEIPEAYYWSKP